ncbi:protein of unknown function [Methylorubrum extorquens]|uniref:Uncharacterized protein n=2 Tax=Methylorubrum extorquens TaxID=408 RepID=A0A2N9AMP5_METEX|nr:protein of unknown function [Methylorubrum extorquens]
MYGFSPARRAACLAASAFGPEGKRDRCVFGVRGSLMTRGFLSKAACLALAASVGACASNRFEGPRERPRPQAALEPATPALPAGTVTSEPLAPPPGASAAPGEPPPPSVAAAPSQAIEPPPPARSAAGGRDRPLLGGGLVERHRCRGKLQGVAVEHALARSLQGLGRGLRQQGSRQGLGLGFPRWRGLPLPAGRHRHGAPAAGRRRTRGRALEIRRAALDGALKRFPTKWTPVRRKKARRNKDRETPA